MSLATHVSFSNQFERFRFTDSNQAWFLCFSFDDCLKETLHSLDTRGFFATANNIMTHKYIMIQNEFRPGYVRGNII